MVPAPSCPYTWDYWTTSSSDSVELTCLMPNSVYIPIRSSWDATLHEVKEELWDRAVKYPLFGMLHDMSGYMFQFISPLSVQEEVDDENKRLRDIKPVCGVLIIIERSVERPEENFLNTQISNLIGKGLNEFDNLKSPEVNDFRMRMRYLAEESYTKRSASDVKARLKYQCPPRLADHEDVPTTLKSHLNNNQFLLATRVAHNMEMQFTKMVDVKLTPQDHINNISKTKTKLLRPQEEYVLKVFDREEYLQGSHPLIQFLYIQETLYRDGVPTVIVVPIDKVPVSVGRDIHYLSSERRRLPSEHSNPMRRHRKESSWNIDKNFTCTIQSVSGLNMDRIVEVICQAGIYHGGKPLCEAQKTSVASVSNDNIVKWDEELLFPIKVYNLPRMARLCFVIYYYENKVKGRKRKDCINKLAWANMMIFDYKDELRTKPVTLFMWNQVADETQGDDLLLHPLGTVVSNPTNNDDPCTALQVSFSDYECQDMIVFPSADVVRSHAEQLENGAVDAMSRLCRQFEQLRVTAEKDPMYEMHEQERKDIWAAREHFRLMAPELLPKLLSCVEWGERAEAASVNRMLASWPPLRVESALELLDYAYADAAVRSFAVMCLGNIRDEELLLYLLQLVQALKHEPYLHCDLTVFLLQRAFDNITIGHFLFWHLRSEMHVAAVSVRFGLILEAYCRGCPDHIGILARQVFCLEKLKWLSNIVKGKKDITKAREALKQYLKEQHCVETLCDFVSPLNPQFICEKIIAEDCRVMDSKKRPLLLEFKNNDRSAPNIRILLKVGDDLRQDMFTLQMLKIMDRLWKNAGYDFRLYPYSCISMEYGVGMIEVVDSAETVANIQKQRVLFNVSSTIYKTPLFEWLREKNTTETAFNKAVNEFTMSCAGYCVATYVLGIADRHPDNIMLRENGQLFHIDFGHFLGHFKYKLGFRRERVPFVLTHDFIHVINKGQKGSGVKEPLEFTVFRNHCETAFKILRKHGRLILSLFSMMTSTGLSQLSSEKDLQYLRDTLVLDLSEEKAMEHFRAKFMEAVRNSWTTSLDWAIHNFDRNN